MYNINNIIEDFNNIQNNILENHLDNLKTLSLSLNYTISLLNNNYEELSLKQYKILNSDKNKITELILITLQHIEIDLKSQITFKDKYNINLIFKNKTNTYYIYNIIKNFNYTINSEKNKLTKTLNFSNYLLKLID